MLPARSQNSRGPGDDTSDANCTGLLGGDKDSTCGSRMTAQVKVSVLAECAFIEVLPLPQ
jgi:hypothetical protein